MGHSYNFSIYPRLFYHSEIKVINEFSNTNENYDSHYPCLYFQADSLVGQSLVRKSIIKHRLYSELRLHITWEILDAEAPPQEHSMLYPYSQ
jgi:hypothetical protein